MVSTILNLIRPKDSTDTMNTPGPDKTSAGREGDFLSILNREITKPSENRPDEVRQAQGETRQDGIIDKNISDHKKDHLQAKTGETREHRDQLENAPSREITKKTSTEKNAERELRPARDDEKTRKNAPDLILAKNDGIKASPVQKKDTRPDPAGADRKTDVISAAAMANLFVQAEKTITRAGAKQTDGSDDRAQTAGKDSTSSGRMAMLLEQMKRRNPGRQDMAGEKATTGDSTVRMTALTGKVRQNEKTQHTDKREDNTPQAVKVQGQAQITAAAVTPGQQGSDTSRTGAERHGDNTNAMIAPVKGLTTPAATRGTMTFNETRPALSQEQIERIMENARVTVRDGRNATLSLRLNPADLGRVTVNLGLEGGVLHGRFLVDSPEIRDLVESNIESIRRELEQSGVSVGEFQVNVRDEGQFNQAGGYEMPFIPARGASGARAETVNEYAASSLHEGAINYVI